MRTVVIMGAGGRGLHDFNVAYRGDPNTRVAGFLTMDGSVGEEGRYAGALAGTLYPAGIPIWPEGQLEQVLAATVADELVVASQDLPHHEVMHVVSRGLAAGVNVTMLGPHETMLRSHRHVIAVTGVRTGVGKTAISRRIAALLAGGGLRVAVVRQPSPVADPRSPAALRLRSAAELADVTLPASARDEILDTIELGFPVYTGLDTGRVVAQADEDADVLVWDGNGSDFPFLRPDLWITVVDALRSDDEPPHHPGEVNLRRADVVVVNNVDSAGDERIQEVVSQVRVANPHARVVLVESLVLLGSGAPLLGRRALVLEDAPALLHGGHAIGAGVLAAREAGAACIVDPRPFAVGAVAQAFERYPHLGPCLPLLDADALEWGDVLRTIDAVDCDVLVAGAAVRPERLAGCAHPVRRVRLELRERGTPTLQDAIASIERLARPMLTVVTS